MPSKEALRERIELFERLVRGKPVRAINLRLRADYAVADLLIDGVRLLNKKFIYTRFFTSSKLRSFS